MRFADHHCFQAFLEEFHVVHGEKLRAEVEESHRLLLDEFDHIFCGEFLEIESSGRVDQHHLLNVVTIVSQARQQSSTVLSQLLLVDLELFELFGRQETFLEVSEQPLVRTLDVGQLEMREMATDLEQTGQDLVLSG